MCWSMAWYLLRCRWVIVFDRTWPSTKLCLADACYRSPCQNGGSCLNVNDDYWCKCTSDYYGNIHFLVFLDLISTTIRSRFLLGNNCQTSKSMLSRVMDSYSYSLVILQNSTVQVQPEIIAELILATPVDVFPCKQLTTANALVTAMANTAKNVRISECWSTSRVWCACVLFSWI